MSDWVGADLSGGALRLWCFDALGRLQTEAETAPPATDDAAALTRHVAQAVKTLAPKAELAVVAGWPGPARRVPCSPLEEAPRVAEVQDLRLLALPRLMQETPPDMIAGDLLHIAGYLAQEPEFDGILCLTGPQSRWIHISAREVVSFQSFLSGELRDLLGGADDGGSDDSFEAAVAATLSRPERLASALHQARLGMNSGEAGAAAELSGALIGAELAASRPYWLGQRVVIVGKDSLSARYASALRAQGAMVETVSGEGLQTAGFIAAKALLSA
jgi:2-dehydro-3-deoxygalactonokinase